MEDCGSICETGHTILFLKPIRRPHDSEEMAFTLRKAVRKSGLTLAPFADGSTAPADINLWETCVDPDVFTELSSFLHEGGDSWQSSDALLFSRLGKRHYDIYRRYIAGPFSGAEELLIENARGADTGF
jgi:hypothetical protein